MEAGSNYPPEYAITYETAGSSTLAQAVAKFPEDVDELMPETPIGEELVEKFMQELYKEMTEAGANEPSSPAANYAEAWKGRESESCGAAVSDSACTVMAGAELAGKMLPVPENGGRCKCKCGSNGRLLVVGNSGEGGVMNGCDNHDQHVDDEEWFERVLSWGPADLVPGFWNDVLCGGGGGSYL